MDGKIKGEIKREPGTWLTTIKITDTTEYLTRFVAEAGDGLFEKKPVELTRVQASESR